MKKVSATLFGSRHLFRRRRLIIGAYARVALGGCGPNRHGKYPPAEPGALGCEPLKAAISGALPSLTSRESFSTASNRPSQFPKTPFCLWRFARYCGYCRAVLVFISVQR